MPRKKFQEVFLLHALNTLWSAKQEDISITSGNLLYVKYGVCSLIARKERFHFGILVAHLAYGSTFFVGSEATGCSGRMTLLYRPKALSGSLTEVRALP